MISLPALPATAQEFMSWPWEQIAPYYTELAARQLDGSNLDSWLADWSQLAALVSEWKWRAYVATTVNTADEAAQERYRHFAETIEPPCQKGEQKLKEKLLASGLEPASLAVPLARIRVRASLYREDNLALQAEEKRLVTEYDKLEGAATVEWDGEEIPLLKLSPFLEDPDRARREHAHRTFYNRIDADRAAMDSLWQSLLDVRVQLAANAGLFQANGAPDYRAYRWQELARLDYTPDDCKQFHDSIEQTFVPAATRLYDKGRRQLGLDTLKPWDLTRPQGFGGVSSPPDVEPLRPFQDVGELLDKTRAVFEHLDPQLGAYFNTMRQEELLDLETRKNKTGGYCVQFAAARRPMVVLSSTPTSSAVRSLLHESGHAFHVWEANHLPYFFQRDFELLPIEFAEVASTGMELLAAPYLTRASGGFYTPAERSRALHQQLQLSICFFPIAALLDAFQHWVYENVEPARDVSTCDEAFRRLWQRFMPGVDYSGAEYIIPLRWRMQWHLFAVPFYYIEYAMAFLGAFQVWANARRDEATAVAAYRRALSLGATATLPELFRAAGANFAFDLDTLRRAVHVLEQAMDELEQQA